MRMKIKQILISAAITFGLTVTLSSALTLAADVCDANSDGVVSTQEAIQCGATGASGGQQDPSKAGDNIDTVIHRLINILSVVVGVVAVVMIILGGFRYITSGGVSEKITSAKNTILYAIIGLVVVALAQLLVRFVLTNATNSPATPSGSSGCTINPQTKSCTP
jgi:hypothetical protein